MNLMKTRYADQAVVRAKLEIGQNNFDVAWKFLEDAHIFAQQDAAMHLYVHSEMLKLAIIEKDVFEICGQILRSILAVPFSIFRLYPSGNSGRSNVGLFSSLPLSKRNEAKSRELDELEKQRILNGGVLKKYERKFPILRE